MAAGCRGDFIDAPAACYTPLWDDTTVAGRVYCVRSQRRINTCQERSSYFMDGRFHAGRGRTDVALRPPRY